MIAGRRRARRLARPGPRRLTHRRSAVRNKRSAAHHPALARRPERMRRVARTPGTGLTGGHGERRLRPRQPWGRSGRSPYRSYRPLGAGCCAHFQGPGAETPVEADGPVRTAPIVAAAPGAGSPRGVDLDGQGINDPAMAKPGALRYGVSCDRCMRNFEAESREELVAKGFLPKHPDTASGWGWTCPECLGAPVLVRSRGKRSGRR